MAKEAKMVTCKHCGNEIAASAKTCPKCGGKNKKPIYKRGWFIALVVIIVLGAIGSMGNSGSDTTTGTNNNSSVTADTSGSTANTETSTEPEQTEEPIVYTPYDVSTLMADLDGNALKAAETYKDQYVTLTGRLGTIDSSGKYITILPADDEWAIIGVQCYIKTDEQKAAVMELSTGDTITVSGKITDVGEVLGYSLDIDTIE